MLRPLLLGSLLASAACTGSIDGAPDAGSLADGSAPTISRSTSSLSVGTYAFQTSTTSGKCIDIDAGRNADGTNIQQWECNGLAPQLFAVESVAGGRVRLRNPQTNKCMDAAGGGKDNGTNIQLWTCNDSAAQSFELRDAANGKVAIFNPNSGRCVDVNGNSPDNRANIQLWDCNNSAAQQFRPVGEGNPGKLDVTFFVISDTHADPPESYDLRAMARVVNTVAASGQWPGVVEGEGTGFVGGPIGNPSGVVFTGDLMGWGVAPTELATFRRYFVKGTAGDQSINFPGYIGLGNHDVDSADRREPQASDFRNQAWGFVDSRHKGGGAPVPVTRFHDASHSYSWDIGGVHFIQAHRAPGDVGYGLANNLDFIAYDLDQHAKTAGRDAPVFMFHHYGMDAFGSQDRWWTGAQRDAYRRTIDGYNVAGIFVGHSHAAFNYTWEGRRVFHVNNAKAEINTGNNDGKGSFAIARITNDRLNVVTCRWENDQGGYTFIKPFYSGPAK